jgi:hypothetical protein
MSAKLFAAKGTVWACAVIAVLGLLAFPVHAAPLKFEAQLVWATDDIKPPEGKKYVPVQSEVRKKLTRLLKWTHYFEVRRINFDLPPGTTKKVPVSPKCQLDVKDLGNASIEVVVFGKGREVARQRQALPQGETLILGGNAPNETAWLVILKRTN